MTCWYCGAADDSTCQSPFDDVPCRRAPSVATLPAHPPAEAVPVCPDCNGDGVVFTHDDSCADDLCALNGDEYSCAGKLEQCFCREPVAQPAVQAAEAVPDLIAHYAATARIRQVLGDLLSTCEIDDGTTGLRAKACAALGDYDRHRAAVIASADPLAQQVAPQAADNGARRLTENEVWNLAGVKPYKFHPDASHVDPAYRDGWNAAIGAVEKMLASPSPQATPAPEAAQATADAWLSDIERDAAEIAFTDYFVHNYPGPDTIIHDPYWHAPKVFRAAFHAIQRAIEARITKRAEGRT